MSKLLVVDDVARLAEAAADRIVSAAANAIAERGRFIVALSGGSTPKATYRLLAEPSRARLIDWSRVEVFWGDERCVPPDHADSNFGMVRRALLERIRIPDPLVHRIRGELPPDESAAKYRAELEAVLGEDGRFDLILLGLGCDGHTASLFPGSKALHEDQRAVAIYVETVGAWRITLTLRVMNEARHVIFLVSGARKADALARVRADESLPAAMVQPGTGTLTWLVDRPAAGSLPADG
ncbi:MAG: 6-phosphogluconolactonase [Anaerolineae bacterium]